jgi:hypothetical protein
MVQARAPITAVERITLDSLGLEDVVVAQSHDLGAAAGAQLSPDGADEQGGRCAR